jgi:hypothetical protein
LNRRADIEGIIINFARGEISDSVSGTADVLCISVGEQNSFDAIDAITVQERFQGVLVISLAAAID